MFFFDFSTTGLRTTERPLDFSRDRSRSNWSFGARHIRELRRIFEKSKRQSQSDRSTTIGIVSRLGLSKYLESTPIWVSLRKMHDDESVTKRSTAGGLQMPGDYGVYPPAGYRSYCSLARKRASEAKRSRVVSRVDAADMRILRIFVHPLPFQPRYAGPHAPRKCATLTGRVLRFSVFSSNSSEWQGNRQMKSNVTLLAGRQRTRYRGEHRGISFGK